jgi:two-component system chemotaxis response regulator CheB
VSDQRPLHVLAIDDSAVVREALRLSLARAPGVRLTLAADALIAESKIALEPPDVILLDLELPRMPGLEFLERLMQRSPLPVVICSAAPADGEQVLRALAAGAVDVVRKPSLDVHSFEEATTLLADSLRAAAAAKGRVRSTPIPASVSSPRQRAAHAGIPSSMVIALGASTGGTDALLQVLRELPPDIPGVVIVQHMPAGFTAAFAQRLDRECPIAVREAQDGDRVEHGLALLAPGGQHMRLRASKAGTAGHLHVELSGGPLVSRHRPSVDVLFHSVAEVAAASAVGAILTGMGDDGAEGMLAMRRHGAVTFAQDEASSVVYGMPLRAQERGGVCRVVPLSAMASHLVEAAAPRRRHSQPLSVLSPPSPQPKQP